MRVDWRVDDMTARLVQVAERLSIDPWRMSREWTYGQMWLAWGVFEDEARAMKRKFSGLHSRGGDAALKSDGTVMCGFREFVDRAKASGHVVRPWPNLKKRG